MSLSILLNLSGQGTCFFIFERKLYKFWISPNVVKASSNWDVLTGLFGYSFPVNHFKLHAVHCVMICSAETTCVAVKPNTNGDDVTWELHTEPDSVNFVWRNDTYGKIRGWHNSALEILMSRCSCLASVSKFKTNPLCDVKDQNFMLEVNFRYFSSFWGLTARQMISLCSLKNRIVSFVS